MPDRQGAANPNAKITEATAALIKQDIVNGDSVAVIAEARKCSRSTVYSIMNDESWSHVAWPEATTRGGKRRCEVPTCQLDALEYERNCRDHMPQVVAARNDAIIEFRRTHSLEATAKEFGLSQGRVSQIARGEAHKRSRRSATLHPFHRAQDASRS